MRFRVMPRTLMMVAAAGLLTAAPTRLEAQSLAATNVEQQPAAPAAPRPHITVTSGLDATSSYMFRGIYQEDRGLVAPAFLDVKVPLYAGAGRVSAVRANVGSWNSFHSGPTGAQGHDSAWYEADYYASVTASAGRWSPGVIATAITSPNAAFGSVYEVGASLDFDDSMNRVAFAPRLFYIVEVSGQADAGATRGQYLELSARPVRKLGRSGRATFALAMPMRTGLSVRGYYESPTSSGLGFASAGLMPSVTLSGSRIAVELHAGVDLMHLGTSTSVFNAGHHNKPIVTVGASVTY